MWHHMSSHESHMSSHESHMSSHEFTWAHIGVTWGHMGATRSMWCSHGSHVSVIWQSHKWESHHATVHYLWDVWLVGDSDEGIKETHDGGRPDHFGIHQVSKETNLGEGETGGTRKNEERREWREEKRKRRETEGGREVYQIIAAIKLWKGFYETSMEHKEECILKKGSERGL